MEIVKNITDSEITLVLKGRLDTTTAPSLDAAVNGSLIADSTGKQPGDKGYIKTRNEADGLEARVTSIENLIAVGGDENDTIDKLQEVLDWFAGIKEDQDPYTVTVNGEEVSLGKGQAGLLETVAGNKKAIGEKATAAVGTEGEEGYVPAKPATGLYKEIADAVAAAAGDAADIIESYIRMNATYADNFVLVDHNSSDNEFMKTVEDAYAVTKEYLDDAILAMDVAETLKESTSKNVKVTYKETDGIVEIVKVETLETKATYTAATETTPADLSVAAADATKLLTGESIAEIKKYVDDKVGNKEVSATVNSEEQDADTYITVSNDETKGHVINLKTATLNGVLGGIEKADNGEYTFTAAEGLADGLATAADVAAVIVSDEEVIAAAFNDHESRVAAMENWPVYDWEEL